MGIENGNYATHNPFRRIAMAGAALLGSAGSFSMSAEHAVADGIGSELPPIGANKSVVLTADADTDEVFSITATESQGSGYIQLYPTNETPGAYSSANT